jgi:hypothetical protein
LFRRGHISQEAITLDDAPDHAVKIGLLVFAQKIGEIGQIVVGAAFHPLAQTCVVETGTAAVPQLQDR